MNIDLLKVAYNDSPAIAAICDHFARRDNNQNETKIHRIIGHLQNEAYEFKRGEIIAAFRRLEEAGVGKYVEGRHGWPSRFVWEAKSLQIAALATEGSSISDEGFGADDAIFEEDFIEHTFVLRPDLTISVELPVDLTPRESDRVAAFVQSLPFGERDF